LEEVVAEAYPPCLALEEAVAAAARLGDGPEVEEVAVRLEFGPVVVVVVEVAGEEDQMCP
jgi:hypothetical protein